jgi:hypothetical protein
VPVDVNENADENDTKLPVKVVDGEVDAAVKPSPHGDNPVN